MNYNKLYKITILSMIFFIIIISKNAYANAGTALMWAIGFHIYIANLLIAILESFILWKFYNVFKYYKYLLLMIGANFFSMFSGFALSILYADLNKIPRFMMSDQNVNEILLVKIIIIISYFVSVIFEFPFIYWFLKNKRTIFEILKIDILINIVSYILLIISYFFFFKIF